MFQVQKNCLTNCYQFYILLFDQSQLGHAAYIFLNTFKINAGLIAIRTIWYYQVDPYVHSGGLADVVYFDFMTKASDKVDNQVLFLQSLFLRSVY